MQKTTNALLTLSAALILASPALAVPDIVLEATCAGGAYVESGTWAASTAKTTASGVSCSGGSRATQGANAYAEFSPNIVTAGVYDVYVSWGAFTPGGSTNKGPNADGVTFRINDQYGMISTVKNQRGHSGCASPNPNAWTSIGAGSFVSGTSGKIRVTNTATGQCNNGPSKRYVNVDAIKLVFNGPVPVEPVTFGTVKARYR